MAGKFYQGLEPFSATILCLVLDRLLLLLVLLIWVEVNCRRLLQGQTDPAGVMVVLTADVTAGVTDLVALIMEGWAMLLGNVCFGLSVYG